MKDPDICMSLNLELDSHCMSLFYPVLQQGVEIDAPVGCSIYSFLVGELALSGEQIQKIQSLFLDGKPVDDLEKAIVREGAHLTFSAALPGLVGMSLRRGSILASFRGSITHSESCGPGNESEGTIHIKLFNLMIAELGPVFLERGIYMKSPLLADILGQTERFRKGCGKILVNGNPVNLDELKNKLISQDVRVNLSIVTEKTS
jgi:hypothetical protein